MFVEAFQPKNIFDDLPNLAPMSLDLYNELNHYLATDIEDMKDLMMWWYEHRGAFPNLSCMAHDYLLILGKSTNFSTFPKYLLFPATTVDVKHVFSQRQLVLSHICSCLSIQSMHTLLCLGAWCQHRLVKVQDLRLALGEEEEVTIEEDELPSDWDTIQGL